MSEIAEQPNPEAKKGARVVEKTKQAVGKFWEKAKTSSESTKKEYWEIRQQMQDRLAWHGGGVYKFYVENMDKVTRIMWGKEPKGGKKIMETAAKISTRIKGALLAGTSATADIVRDAALWPFRLFLPIPKDVFKRGALLKTYAKAADRLAVVAAAGVPVGVVAGEMALNKGIKAAAKAVVTAPEVGYRMAKPRIEAIVDKIKKPRPPVSAKI